MSKQTQPKKETTRQVGVFVSYCLNTTPFNQVYFIQEQKNNKQCKKMFINNHHLYVSTFVINWITQENYRPLFANEIWFTKPGNCIWLHYRLLALDFLLTKNWALFISLQNCYLHLENSQEFLEDSLCLM